MKILPFLSIVGCAALFGESLSLDTVSVTATREARATKDVPQSIAVVNSETIEATKAQNIKDLITGIPGVLVDSKNGGYDARLIIRGAGLKAPYGVREIMVLRDGVPMTDPDTMTRFDFIDTQDIERVEVTKGPGSIAAGGVLGGTIQIISKSVFSEEPNRIKLGLGTDEAQNFNLRYSLKAGDKDYLSLTASRRAANPDYRRHNTFDTNQASIKYGKITENGILESELAYTEANLEFPGSMSAAEFETFKTSGKQDTTVDAWKHTGRYSKILFFNTKYETEFGNLKFKPRVYINRWSHYHPVTGIINDSSDNTTSGVDLEAAYAHKLLGQSGSLVFGATYRQDITNDSKKYQYKDYTTRFGGRITATLSDEKGALAEVDNEKNKIGGVFAQESLKFGNLTFDVGARFDKSSFDLSANEITAYNYSTGKYVAGAGFSQTKKTYELFAPKLGASYAITPSLSVYASIARAEQTPSTSELSDNTDLKKSKATNAEIGLKGRMSKFSFDTAIYRTITEDEVVGTYVSGQTQTQNAGKSDKKGFEASGEYAFTSDFSIGGSYAYSDYKYISFTEVARVGMTTYTADRSGNRLKYIPKHQYSLFANYKYGSFKARVKTDTWSKYFIDDANSQDYEGYRFVTSAMFGWEKGSHSLNLNVDNLFDKRYAMEVKKDATSTSVYYTGAARRSALVTYAYKF